FWSFEFIYSKFLKMIFFKDNIKFFFFFYLKQKQKQKQKYMHPPFHHLSSLSPSHLISSHHIIRTYARCKVQG
ncbi:MAG: hypothetical protein N6V41_01295, partial [Candidatus Portiera aleyrodidarum]|nr:hypothetical protein [Candidatus Portiera aleyrodidarum]